MAHSDYKSYNRPLSPEDEQRLKRHGGILAVLAAVFMVAMTLLVHTGAIRLHPSTVNEEMIRGYAGRVEFTVRYQTLLVAWLTFNIFATIFGRLTRRALNPLDEKSEEHVQIHKNILTNSYEQIALSVFSQLIYISFASPECILKTIPLVNIIQFIGRITFFAGYPFKRSFGFFCTMVPTLVLVAYNLYKFFSFMGLY